MAARNGVDLTVEHGTMLAAGIQSLADVLASGPLPLPVALAYGKEIASVVAGFHRDGHAYGALAPARIAIGPHGPILPPPNGASRFATPASDLRDFGLLLHQMLTGLDSGDDSLPASADDALEPSPETVRSAALRLAERCRSAAGQSGLQRVSTELRLLQIMVTNFGPEEVAGPAAKHRSVQQPAGRAAPAKPAKPRGSGGCPSCGSAEVFLSHQLTILERILAVVDMKTYRCYSCCHRFINVFGVYLPRPDN